jgi:hypothetical protein
VTFESESKLKRIEGHAFRNTFLVSIVIPKSVEVIGEFCFFGVGDLRSFSFEPGSRLQRFGRSVFQLAVFEKITIPASVQAIGVNCFAGCQKLKEIECEGNVPNLGTALPMFCKCSIKVRWDVHVEDKQALSKEHRIEYVDNRAW